MRNRIANTRGELRYNSVGKMSGSLRSLEAGDFFFQPLELHLEPADLLVELGLDRLALVAIAAAAVAEERLDAVEELLLPLADLDRVDLIRRGELRQGLGLLGGLESDLGLEARRVSLPGPLHDAPRDGTEIFDQFNIPSGPVLGVHLTEELRAIRRAFPGCSSGPRPSECEVGVASAERSVEASVRLTATPPPGATLRSRPP